jgi:pyruvate formate lyase activating enzyme
VTTRETIPLAEILDAHTKEGELYEKLPDNRVSCYACGHRCTILDGLRGICRVRFNKGGTLYVPTGYVSALQADPTEKKPFFHVMPGSTTLTFGMLGCDYHCSYCQNWLTSQTLRDPASIGSTMTISAEEMMAAARRTGARLVASSYNEPLITAEWAVDIFRLAREQGLGTLFVSNGNATREVLKYLRPWTDGYKIDLKSMSPQNYRFLGGKLDNVLDTIGMVTEMGFWVEVVTLVVPSWNDSDQELREAARFLASVSPDIPWHVTAFHKDYKMTDPANTPAETLIRAAEMGYEAGLHYVYAGNMPGGVGRLENTYCHNCGELLVERFAYRILKYNLTRQGTCPACSTAIPGIWA